MWIHFDEYYFIRVLVLFCTGIQTTVNTSILRTHIGRAACLGPPAWQGPDQVRYCAYPTDQTSTLKVFFSSVDILPWIFIKLSSLILTFLFVTNTSGSWTPMLEVEFIGWVWVKTRLCPHRTLAVILWHHQSETVNSFMKICVGKLRLMTVRKSLLVRDTATSLELKLNRETLPLTDAN